MGRGNVGIGTTTLVSLFNAAGAAEKFTLTDTFAGSNLFAPVQKNALIFFATKPSRSFFRILLCGCVLFFKIFTTPSKDNLMLAARNSGFFIMARRFLLSLPLAMTPGYLLAAQTDEVNLLSTGAHASQKNTPLLSLRGKAHDQALEHMKAAVCGLQPGLYGTIANPILIAAPLEPSRRTAHRICRVLDAPPRP